MKLIYVAPEGEIIDFRALEHIAKVDDNDRTRGGASGEVNPGTGGVTTSIPDIPDD